jgi:hypothetical protein
VDIVFDVNIDPKIQVPSWNWDYMTLIKIWKMYWLRNLAPAETCHFENDWRTIPQVIKDNSTVWNNSNDQWMKDQLHIANQNLRWNQ